MTPSPRLLDLAEVSIKLCCSKRHTQRLADAGSIPRPIKIGRLVRWRSTEIDAFVEGRFTHDERKGSRQKAVR